MGQISRALGQGSSFTYQGQTYRLSPWKYKILGEFELYLQDVAIATVRRMRPTLTEEEHQKLLHATAQDITSGVYTFGSARVQEALNSRQHFEHLFYLCLRDNHPNAEPELVRAMAADLGIEVLMQKVTEANEDPTQPTSRTSTDSSGTAAPAT